VSSLSKSMSVFGKLAAGASVAILSSLLSLLGGGVSTALEAASNTQGTDPLSPVTDAMAPVSWGVAAAQGKGSQSDDVWRSEVLNLLGIGMAVGDVTGSGGKNLVIIDPSTVYLYAFAEKQLRLLAQYAPAALELKSVDVVQTSKKGPCRIYVTAQNRAAITSFVLEFRRDRLTPVIDSFPYYLREILYPTRGPLLLGQQRGLNVIYHGPIYRLEDKGNELVVRERFGVPLKIPIFGFAIGDFRGDRKPLIAVYDREDKLRIYSPDGKRLYRSTEYYGGSDVVLRMTGLEDKVDSRIRPLGDENEEREFMRPRIMALDLQRNGVYQILAISHSSKTGRFLSRTKMLEEGMVIGLEWNGDALEQRWKTPKIQGMITDFAVDEFPGLSGRRLITLERQKTDWLSFLSSRSQVRAYNLDMVMQGRVSERAE